MKKIIQNLRNRPEEDRRHVLHVVTFIFAIIFVTLWIFSLSKSITSEETKKKVKEDLKPFSMLKDSIINNTNQ